MTLALTESVQIITVFMTAIVGEAVVLWLLLLNHFKQIILTSYHNILIKYKCIYLFPNQSLLLFIEGFYVAYIFEI